MAVDIRSYKAQSEANRASAGLIPHPSIEPLDGGPFGDAKQVAFFGKRKQSQSESSSGQMGPGFSLIIEAILVASFLPSYVNYCGWTREYYISWPLFIVWPILFCIYAFLATRSKLTASALYPLFLFVALYYMRPWDLQGEHSGTAIWGWVWIAIMTVDRLLILIS